MGTTKISIIVVIICTLSSFPLLFFDAQGQNVPDWIKNTAKWFGEGQVSETEFLNAIKYLIENKIIILDEPKAESPKTFSAESIRAEVIIPNGNSDQSNSGFYVPLHLQVHKGTTVIWVNEDNVGHTVQSQDDKGNPTGHFSSKILNTGDRFAFKFEESGVYNYYCTFHPWRVGSVSVS